MENCQILQHYFDLSSDDGWKKEVNLVSWYGKPPKYDIREWSEDHSKCGKGITLSQMEFFQLIESGNDILKNKPTKDVDQRVEELITNQLADLVAEKQKEIALAKQNAEKEERKTSCAENYDVEKLKKMSFVKLNSYFNEKYGRDFPLKWTKEEKAIYSSKDPNANYSESGEIDYFDGEEDSSNPFIWEKAGKVAPRVPMEGSGAYVPRKKR